MNPAVRRLWIAQLISITGDFLAIFAVVSLASFRMHSTPAGITGVTISYMLPLALFSPLSGAFVDRTNPKHTMIASDLTRAVLILLIPIATTLTAIYAILFALSTVSTFFIPAQSVTVRTLVPREGLLAVNTRMQQTILVMRLVSPAIAGALVGRFGPNSCFYLDTASFLFSATLLSKISVNPGSPMKSLLLKDVGQAGSLRTDCQSVLGLKGRASLKNWKNPSPSSFLQNAQPVTPRGTFAGIRFIAGHPEISFVTAAMAAATFAISAFSPLIAVFVRDILHKDVHTLAVISAAIGLGMIVGTQSARRFTKQSSPRQIVVASLAAIAASIAIMGVATITEVSAAGAFLLGSAVGLLIVPAQTLIQSETPIAIAGRVNSGVTSLISTAQILGLTVSATLAATIGIRPLFLLSATILASLATLGSVPAFQQSSRLTTVPED